MAATESSLTTLETSEDKMHGKVGVGKGWGAPIRVTEFDVNARLSFTDIKAHEYIDQPDVLREKVTVLAGLIRQSTNMIAYTGAGISTAAGIDDYATKAKTESVTSGASRPVVKDWKNAQPTRSHYVLTALYEAGLLKHWVQQNHDSLPQKAGFPQHALNEIHGSLHDPANPIVPYEGTLRADLFEWMKSWRKRADLCLALGTSMSGFNADAVPVSIGKRFCEHGQGLGTVIINLQQTRHDEIASLRIFAKLDDVMDLLATELGVHHAVRPSGTLYRPSIPESAVIEEDVYRIPFGPDGAPSATESHIWDLRVGRYVQLTGGPYEGDIGMISSKNEDGHYCIVFENSFNKTFNVRRRTFSLWMGNWWVEMATKGYGITGIGGLVPFLSVEPPVIPAIEPQEDLAKYTKMRKIGLAEPMIRQKMECDGFSLEQIESFFQSLSIN